jgi:hypothetical protein
VCAGHAARTRAGPAPDELVGLHTDAVREQTLTRFARAMALKAHGEDDLAGARAWVQAMLGLEVWAHSLYLAPASPAHEASGSEHGH